MPVDLRAIPGETLSQYESRVLPMQEPGTQNAAYNSGDAASILSQGRDQASNVSSAIPSDPNLSFGAAVMAMLTKAQLLGSQNTANVNQAQLNAQGQAANAVLNPNLTGMQGASPSQLNSVINAQASPFQTAADIASQQGKTFSQQLSDFGTILNNVNTYQQQIQTRAEQQFKDLVTNFGGQGLMDWAVNNPQQASQLESILGYGKGSLAKLGSTLKEQEAAAKAQQNAVTDYYKALAAGVNPVGTLPSGASPTPETSPSGYTGVPGTTGSATINTSAPGYATTPVPGAGGLTQAAIDQAALQFVTTGVMPSIGLGSTGLGGQRKTAIQNRAGELGAGTNIAANKVYLQAQAAALKQQTEYLNNTQRAIQTADANFQLLVDTAGKAGINDYSSPLVNQLKNSVNRGIIGNGELNQFYTGIQTLRTEYAQVLARGGEVTDAVRNEALQLIPDDISLGNLQKVFSYIKQEGANVVSNSQTQIQNIQNQINGIVGGGSVGGSTQPQTMHVKRLSDGAMGTIPSSEYDPKIYQQVQ